MKGGVGLSKRSSAETALLLGALVFYLYIAWSVPYSTTDDLQWGMDQGAALVAPGIAEQPVCG